MRIVVRSRGLAEGHAIREHAVRRLHFALGRWIGRVNEVAVMIERASGRAAGVPAVYCRVRARLRDGAELVIEDFAGDPWVATGLAAQRLGRVAGRRFEREHDARHAERSALSLGGRRAA